MQGAQVWSLVRKLRFHMTHSVARKKERKKCGAICLTIIKNFNANTGPYSQSYGFSSSHVWMWELDYKESWVPRKRCFWTVVLENTLESPLDWEEIQPIHPKGYQSWIFIGQTGAEAEAPLLWPPDAKNWLVWKDNADAEQDWRWGENGTTEDEMVGWHHRLNGREFE